jgi:hypothetical protein
MRTTSLLPDADCSVSQTATNWSTLTLEQQEIGP